MAVGDLAQALKAIQRSLQIEETENSKILFVQCLRNLSSIPHDAALQDNLIRALSEPWGRPVDLSRFVVNFLKCHDTIGTCIRRFTGAWPNLPPIRELFTSSELADIYGDQLLSGLLEETIVFDIELERFLTAMRRLMLEVASATEATEEVDHNMLRFFCALARQCLVNEYVFACTAAEKTLADHLKTRVIEGISSRTDLSELWLVAIAAFFPLTSLAAADLLVERSWSAPVARLVTKHVREPREESDLAACIPRLTSIQDTVSLAVKQQYEESPYPRWTKTSPVGRSTTIDVYLRRKFPRAPLPNIAHTDAAEILIAGCGTGQHSIETARQFEGARILAIDLSLASLGYAKRKTRELGLRNIEYAQADILQLKSIGRSFDVIEASGVLHHLADPLAGWQLLLSLLRPGGLMRLGLYSRLARQELSDARAFIAEHGYGTSVDEIRRCREALMRFESDTAPAKVTGWADFFSTSGCRDLLFHVREREFTLPDIDAFIKQNRLLLLGFDLPGGILERFRQRFPEDATLTDLSRWHEFEIDNPSVFTGMYQFWVRKAA